MCFKIVRTTDTGGIKMIYNGVPSNGRCSNSDQGISIGLGQFNANRTSPADVGYMYGIRYEYSSAAGVGWKYAPDVRYSNGSYTLVSKGGYGIETKYSISTTSLNHHHYTCGSSTNTTCTSVRYVYNNLNGDAYYITLSNGKKVEDALIDMFDNNITSSTIKGNSTTSGTVDYWYYNNIDQVNDSKGNSYSTYIEDTVYCNDRSFNNYSESGWNPDGGNTSNSLNFGIIGRTSNPIVTCPREVDSFTVSSTKGNGALDYPVGLLTQDEARMAGATDSLITGNYLWAGGGWWFSTPHGTAVYNVMCTWLNAQGGFSAENVDSNNRIRPVISLSANTMISDGNGSSSSPYLIKER